MSPAEFVFGSNPRLPQDLNIGYVPPQLTWDGMKSIEQKGKYPNIYYRRELSKTIRDYANLKSREDAAQKVLEFNADKKPHYFEPGDKVLFKPGRNNRKIGDIAGPKYITLYEVVERYPGTTNYKLRSLYDKSERANHINVSGELLKLAFGEGLPALMEDMKARLNLKRMATKRIRTKKTDGDFETDLENTPKSSRPKRSRTIRP
jgi:hypothetical protein